MPIEAVRIQDCWDSISPHIDKILKDLPWRDFRKEDLYLACANGNAAVFVDSDFSPGESFCIARIDENESTGEKVLFLWVARSSAPDTAKRVQETVENIARNSGCSAVEFITGSTEIVDHGKIHGFDKVLHRCRKEV